MKLTLRSCTTFLYISFSLLVLAILWGVRTIWQSSEWQQAVDTRADTRATLAELTRKENLLNLLSERWAVRGTMSFEIRQTITAAFPDAVFPDPTVVGVHRLHMAAVSISGETAPEALGVLRALQGLPVRVQQLSLDAQENGQVHGMLEVAWLERL